jgi:hypothetical protein
MAIMVAIISTTPPDSTFSTIYSSLKDHCTIILTNGNNGTISSSSTFNNNSTSSLSSFFDNNSTIASSFSDIVPEGFITKLQPIEVQEDENFEKMVHNYKPYKFSIKLRKNKKIQKKQFTSFFYRS